jgi:hypothetical protein
MTETKLTPEPSKFSRHSDIENFDPEDFKFLLGEAPVIDEFEDKSEYDTISHSMLESIRPTNYIEVLFVVDLIDVTFEILNLRRIIVACKSVAAGDGIEACLERALLEDAPPGPAQELLRFEAKRKAKAASKKWREDSHSRDDIEQTLGANGISEEAIQVEVFLRNLPTLETIEKRLFSAQQRRNDLLREISVHRELARRARLASEKVIESIPKLPPKQE